MNIPYNFYFEGQKEGVFGNVGIGYNCTDPLYGKLSVIQRKPITALNTTMGNYAFGGTFTVTTSLHDIENIAVWGISIGKATIGIGVAGTSYGSGAVGTDYSIGVYGEAFPHLPASPPPPIPANPLAFDWAGAFNGNVWANSIYILSDSTIKNNIRPISNSLSIIDNLKPKSFFYDSSYINSEGLFVSNARQYGFIAQDVENILPELVTNAIKPSQFDTLGNVIYPAATYKALNYNAFIGILTQGVQDLDSITKNIITQVDSIPQISFGAACDSSSVSFELPSDWRVGLGGSNLYFDGQEGSLTTHVGIGYGCGDKLPGKLSVHQSEAYYGESVAGYFNNTSTSDVDLARGVVGLADSSYAKVNCGGYFTANNDNKHTNIGVYARAEDGGQNYGIWAEAAQYKDDYSSVAGYFNGNIDGVGLFLYASDAKFKNNISNITNATSIIEQLQPRTFAFNTAAYPYMNFSTGNQLGFVAQELESVLPNLVKNSVFKAEYDSVGNMIHDTVQYKSVYYDGLIPIVVQAVKELKSKNDSITDKLNGRIDSLRNVISTFNSRMDELEERIEDCCKHKPKAMDTPSDAVVTEVELENVQAIVLDQNVPNPFAESTVITYFIPDNINYAQIIFTDNYGRIMKTVDIKISGAGMIKVYAANLSSGTYTYSLMVDGKVVETKKMMCVK